MNHEKIDAMLDRCLGLAYDARPGATLVEFLKTLRKNPAWSPDEIHDLHMRLFAALVDREA